MANHTELFTPDVPQGPPEPGSRKASPEKPPRRHPGFGWLWLLILGGLGYFGYRQYQASEEKARATAAMQASRAEKRAVPVVAVPVRRGDIAIYIRGLGTAAAYNTVVVKSRVDGQLMAIHFQEGQYVKQGEPLAEIDPRPFQVQLEQAEGQLARDQAQLNDARVNLQRFQALWDAKVIAKQQLDTQAALVGQYQGTIEADKAAIDNARLQLTYAHITAPISGRVGLRLVDVGNIVHASDPNGIISIAQLQPIAVLFTIPSDNLPPVLDKLNAGVRLRVDAYDRNDTDKIASGRLLTVDNTIDASTGTSRLKAEFANQDLRLFPNQFLNCRLLLDVKHGVVIVPTAAVQRGPQGTYVFVAQPDGTAALRPIETGIVEGNEEEVKSGLTGGEMVVVDGQDKLQAGTRIDVRTPQSGRGTQARRPVPKL